MDNLIRAQIVNSNLSVEEAIEIVNKTIKDNQ